MSSSALSSEDHSNGMPHAPHPAPGTNKNTNTHINSLKQFNRTCSRVKATLYLDLSNLHFFLNKDNSPEFLKFVDSKLRLQRNNLSYNTGAHSFQSELTCRMARRGPTTSSTYSDP
jgi:hypothetical protein